MRYLVSTINSQTRIDIRFILKRGDSFAPYLIITQLAICVASPVRLCILGTQETHGLLHYEMPPNHGTV